MQPRDSRGMDKLPAIILAGGRASRLGGIDKALVTVAGRTLLDHVLTRLAGQCWPVAISANDDPTRFSAFGLPVLPDSLPDRPGPLAGILAGLDWAAARNAPALISVAVDTPFFPSDLAIRLRAEAGPGGMALAASRDAGGRVHSHPTFAIWPTPLRDALRQTLLEGQRRVSGFAALQSPGFAVWEEGRVDPFFNVNRPEDVAAAERIAANWRER